MSRFRRAAARDVVLIAIAVVLLVVAGLIVTKCGGDPAAPTDESAWTNFVCEACGEFFYLNGAEIDEAWRTPAERRALGASRTMALRCKKCGELSAVRAERCPEHGEVIKLSPGEDDPKKCSQCGFQP